MQIVSFIHIHIYTVHMHNKMAQLGGVNECVHCEKVFG